MEVGHAWYGIISRDTEYEIMDLIWIHRLLNQSLGSDDDVTLHTSKWLNRFFFK